MSIWCGEFRQTVERKFGTGVLEAKIGGGIQNCTCSFTHPTEEAFLSKPLDV